ncbi:MAG: LuxR C-terminal-related transcriptional regulator [Actinomycetota bacterium]
MTRRLVETVDVMAEVIDVDSIDELKHRYFEAVVERLPSFAQGVYLHDRNDADPTALEVRGLSSFYARQYEKSGRGVDPVTGTAIATGEVVDSSLLPRRAWRDAGDASEIFREYEMGHLLCAPFSIDGRFAGTLNLARRADAPRFTWQERRQMGVVARLFAVGVQSCRRLERARWEAALHGEALERCGIAVVVTDLDAVERLPNERAQALLDSLIDPWPSLDRALEPDGDTRLVHLESVLNERVAVQVSSFRHGTGPGFVSILQPVGDAVIGLSQTVADLLTPREAQVAVAVASGLHDAEVANTLHISTHTVRHHLKSVYRKLDVHTRIELLNRLRR